MRRLPVMRMSAGDRVMAENYLQHAEHYNRIIAAAQAQMPIQQVRDNRDEFDDDLDDDRDEMDNGNANGNGNANAEPQPPVANGSGPQPVIDGTPAEVALNQDAAAGDGERLAISAPTASQQRPQRRRRPAPQPALAPRRPRPSGLRGRQRRRRRAGPVGGRSSGIPGRERGAAAKPSKPTVGSEEVASPPASRRSRCPRSAAGRTGLTATADDCAMIACERRESFPPFLYLTPVNPS